LGSWLENEMNTKVMFSSLRQDWRTPKKLYTGLNQEFNFDFDPCPPNPKTDGLNVAWGQRNYVNPPYSEVSKWIEKGVEESLKGKLVVFLTASRTDTRWFHDYALKYAKEIRFIKGRLKFSGYKNSAPFPSCVIIFDGRSP